MAVREAVLDRIREVGPLGGSVVTPFRHCTLRTRGGYA